MIFILSCDFGGLIQKGGSLACTITSNDTRPPPGKFQSWCTVAEAMSHQYLWVSNYKEGQTEQVSGWHYEPGLDWFALRVVLTWFSFGYSHSNRPQQNKHPIHPRSMYWPNLTINYLSSCDHWSHSPVYEPHVATTEHLSPFGMPTILDQKSSSRTNKRSYCTKNCVFLVWSHPPSSLQYS